MKYVLAIDSFKGSLNSYDISKIVSEAIISIDKEAEVVSLLVSDGGEGMLDAYVKAANAVQKTVQVHDPLMRVVTSRYAIRDKLAIIESSQACGLELLEPEEYNPLAATTYGVGELIIDAMKQGCNDFIIGLGGSATCDCGKGMLRALSPFINDIQKNCKFTLALDVENPLLGRNGAARVFARQKGANEQQIELLERRARDFSNYSAENCKRDCSMYKGAGAAGGLGYAFMQFLNAKALSGAELLFDMLNFNGIISDADLIITGEGRADIQTLMGKLPFRVLQRAKVQKIPTVLIAGSVLDKNKLSEAGFSQIYCIHEDAPKGVDLLERNVTTEAIRRTVKKIISSNKL